MDHMLQDVICTVVGNVVAAAILRLIAPKVAALARRFRGQQKRIRNRVL